MCDAEGCGYDWVLGGVEVAEVDSGDYEIWMTDWGFWEGFCVGGVHGCSCCYQSVLVDGGRKGRVWSRRGGKGGEREWG